MCVGDIPSQMSNSGEVKSYCRQIDAHEITADTTKYM